jgi:hypothetical protein
MAEPSLPLWPGRCEPDGKRLPRRKPVGLTRWGWFPHQQAPGLVEDQRPGGHRYRRKLGSGHGVVIPEVMMLARSINTRLFFFRFF